MNQAPAYRVVLAAALAGLVSTSVGDRLAAQQRSGQPSGPPAQPAPAPLAEEYRIGPEDVLEIVVWGQDQLTKVVQVRPDGRISLPLVNDVRAAGLTPMELRQALAKSLMQSEFIRNPEVSVTVREVNSMRVSVIGQVRTSGRFLLRSRMTVLDALAMAGGLTDFSRKDKIRVSRQDGTVVELSYARLLDDADPRANIQLQPGDVIIIQ
jgi:polysaccharide export outer membrane protein